MKILRIELAEIAKAGQIQNFEPPALEGDQAAIAQIGHRAIGVDSGDAECIAQFILRDRHVERLIFDQFHGLKPGIELADQMRHVPVGQTAAAV